MTRHRIKYGDDSHALTTDLDVGKSAATTATCTIKDMDGGYLLNGTIESIADSGFGDSVYTYTGHAVAVGDTVLVAGTTDNDGSQAVTEIETGTFRTAKTFVATDAGTYEITAAKATMLTATALGAAATKGKGSITLTAVTSIVEGYPLRIAMSADGGDEDVIIAAVNSSTKVCELTDYLKFSHTNGAAIRGRRIAYSFDASQSDFTSGLDFNVIWELTDTDDPAWREDGEILKREVAFSGLARKFKTLYPHYYTRIPDGEFETYQGAAFNDLRILFVWKAQRDLDKLVNPDDLEPVLLRQIAYNIAFAGDDSWEKEREAMKVDRDDWLTRMSQARIWVDADQDDDEGDSEVQAMEFALPRRQL